VTICTKLSMIFNGSTAFLYLGIISNAILVLTIHVAYMLANLVTSCNWLIATSFVALATRIVFIMCMCGTDLNPVPPFFS